jgi:hypothetical protein
MEDYAFKVNIAAMVRVRADDENVARKVVPTVLGAPSTLDIRLANEGNAAMAHHATITSVQFSGEDCSIELVEIDGVAAPAPAIRSPRPRGK